MLSITPTSFSGMTSSRQSPHLFRALTSAGHTASKPSLSGLYPNILTTSPGPAHAFRNVKGRREAEKKGRKEGKNEDRKEGKERNKRGGGTDNILILRTISFFHRA